MSRHSSSGANRLTTSPAVRQGGTRQSARPVTSGPDSAKTTRRPLRDLGAVRAAFERAIESHSQVLGQFFLARYLGLEVRYEDGRCIVEFDVREDLLNPAGRLQGGVIATALDVSMVHLVQHLVAGPAATVDLGVQYHRGVSTGRLRSEAGIVHRGKTLWFAQAAITGATGERIASGRATIALARCIAAAADE